MRVVDLDTLGYRECWQLQEQHHAEVVAGEEERVLVVEHPPVITLGRRANDARKHLKVDEKRLKQFGVELVESDRGGDITFHGPGQVVVYPIIRLADHGLSVGGYVRKLELSMIETLKVFGLNAHREDGLVGTWVHYHGITAKVGAIGVRIRQGVSMHGLALNVDTDLSFFDLIVPCGLQERGVTSMRKLLRDACPSYVAVKSVLCRKVIEQLGTSPQQKVEAHVEPSVREPAAEAWLIE